MKLAIITGGSKGLGKALVDLLSNDGWDVVELSRSGESEYSVWCDFSNVESVNQISTSLFPTLAENHWNEVVLISNAGDVSPIAQVSNLSSPEIVKNLSINQASSFTIISQFMSAFRNHNIRKIVVNISSGAALKGLSGWAMYCASKAASENFINALVCDEQHQDFPFQAINYDPGIMDTGMQKKIRNSDEHNFPAKEVFVDYKNSGDLRSPEYVANDLFTKIQSELTSGERYSVS